MKHKLVFFLFCFATSHSFSQTNKNFYVAPAVSLGYTFWGGIHFGFDVDFGLWQKMLSEEREFNTGFSYSMSWSMIYHDHFHRISAVNFMAETDNLDLKAGFGVATDPHGYRKNIRCKALGFNTDVSFTGNKSYIPWAGIKMFYYDWGSWYGFDHPYLSPYVKYKYDFLNKSGIK